MRILGEQAGSSPELTEPGSQEPSELEAAEPAGLAALPGDAAAVRPLGGEEAGRPAAEPAGPARDGSP